MKPSIKNTKEVQKRRPPATTIESRENQLIALAVDQAERQLMNGTASSQVITHYLKLGTTRQQMENRLLEEEIRLKQAKTKAIQEAKSVEELYKNALNAMKSYRGSSSEDEYED